MAQKKQTTNFAEIAQGFLAGLSAIRPLFLAYSEIEGMQGPPTILFRLNNPDSKIYINFEKDPMVVQVSGTEPSAEMILTIDADMLHYLIWGKLPVVKAMNEKLLIIENNRSMSPEDQPGGGIPGGPLLFNNILYEMYLIRIGAARLITENTMPEFPEPGEQRLVKEIPLDPVPDKSMLGAIINPLALALGWLAGLILRLYFRFRRDENLEAPLVYSTVPDPFPPIPPASSGARLALMKFLFRRIDIFSVIENMVKGIMATGPFK
jgi:hypothetical protein